MFHYLEKNDDAGPEQSIRPRRRKLWFATVAGLTGVVSLAAVGVGANAGAASPDGPDDKGRPASQRQSTDDGRHPGGNEQQATKGGDDLGRPGGRQEARQVPCDANRLVIAILQANADQGGTLRLAKGCTYSLRTAAAGTGLPTITSAITILGEGATIERAYDVPNSGATAFRIFRVGPTGNLQLADVTLQNGLVAQGSPVAPAAGGAILVDVGGQLLVEKSVLTGNIVAGTTTSAAANGGAIENLGTTVVKNSTLSLNTVFTEGGAVHNSGRLVLADTVVEANKSGSPTTGGGGVDSVGGSVTISGSKFTGNLSGGFGGGLRVAGGSATVDRTQFTFNLTTFSGGAIAVTGTGTGTEVLLHQVDMTENAAAAPASVPGNGGGGSYVGAGSRLTVQPGETKIIGNSAGQGSGGGILNLGTLTLADTLLTRNQAGAFGGGIANTATGTVAAVATTITLNLAVQDGGGIYNLAPATAVTLDPRSEVVKNSPDNCAGPGTPIANCFG